MSYISIQTRAQIGLDSPRVNVEVHFANGLPCFNIVGLPELAVKESRERVRAGYAGINIANAVNYFQENHQDYAVV